MILPFLIHHCAQITPRKAAVILAATIALTLVLFGPARAGGVSLNGVVPQLAAKARQIVQACGSKVVSARSRRSNRSNHPIGRAVDLKGNPKCMYRLVKNWPGGVSTDYWSAPGGPHLHLSYNPGGQEWGLRFAHRKPNRMFTTYAAAKAEAR